MLQSHSIGFAFCTVKTVGKMHRVLMDIALWGLSPRRRRMVCQNTFSADQSLLESSLCPKFSHGCSLLFSPLELQTSAPQQTTNKKLCFCSEAAKKQVVIRRQVSRHFDTNVQTPIATIQLKRCRNQSALVGPTNLCYGCACASFCFLFTMHSSFSFMSTPAC